VRLGIESWFFVETKSFIFSVVKKRNDFSRVVLLGARCVAWLLSMVEEVLRNPGSFGQFLEVAVYTVGGQRGMILFPEGRDGRSWGRVFGELSKALAFF